MCEVIDMTHSVAEIVRQCMDSESEEAPTELSKFRSVRLDRMNECSSYLWGLVSFADILQEYPY